MYINIYIYTICTAGLAYVVSSVNHICISTWYVHLQSGLSFIHLNKLRVLKIFIIAKVK